MKSRTIITLASTIPVITWFTRKAVALYVPSDALLWIPAWINPIDFILSYSFEISLLIVMPAMLLWGWATLKKEQESVSNEYIDPFDLFIRDIYMKRESIDPIDLFIKDIYMRVDPAYLQKEARYCKKELGTFLEKNNKKWREKHSQALLDKREEFRKANPLPGSE
jgi:hypothetical protein